MLLSLRVKNFILMDELELSLEPGLNVLTGETGAGKSIVVGALSLVLGGRANADLVRPGATEAEVEALFDLTGLDLDRLPATTRLVQAGITDGGELAIRRVIQASGRSRAYLNGRLCTTSELALLAPELADVASQHESVALTDPASHLGHLDRFAKLDAARKDLSVLVAELESIQSSIDELRSSERSGVEREAFLKFQRQTIADVAPRPSDLDDLAAERRRLRHSEKLRELIERAANRLEAEDGLCDQLARVASDLRSAAELDEELESLAKSVDVCWAELRDTASRSMRYLDGLETNPNRLDEVEERLYRIEQLLRQFGPTLADVMAAEARISRELDDLENAESRLEQEERALADRLPAVEERAMALSLQRRKAADKLGVAIGQELAELGMGGAKIRVEVEPLTQREASGALAVAGARLSRDGIDRVEFLIAPNKGMEPKPLRKIASGGELSRALLALKRVLAESGSANLYVFDEVDTGVGGAVAERIGAAIADVARHHQVLCITHLAPIAAFGDAHYVVSKNSTGETTTSEVTRVTGEARVAEIARMISGAKVTAAGLLAAKDMIDHARSHVEASLQKPKRPKR